MALTDETALGPVRQTSMSPRARDRWRWVLPAAAVVAGLGLTYLVGHDGSPLWRLVRLAVTGALTALLAVRLGRARRPERSALAFAAGLVALPVGIGVALPFAASSGFDAMSTAGVLTLAGGLVLALAGWLGLVRSTPGWWRLVVAPVLALALVTSCWTLGVAVAATNVPPTELGAATPADRGLSYRDVTFTTADGVRLSGWYVPSSNGAAVVVLHGAGSTRSAVLDQAAVLARHGYGVLLFDARGHGLSEGRAMDFGWYGDADVGAAVSFLDSQPDVDPSRIAALGLSMGGEEAIGAAAVDPRIRAVVAEGATTRVAADRAWLSDAYGWRGTLQEGVEWLQYSITDLLTAAHSPSSLRSAVRAAAPRPVLLIAGGSVPDEPWADRFIRSASPASVELWVVSDAGHTGGLHAHPVAWEHRVVGFLDRTFRGT